MNDNMNDNELDRLFREKFAGEKASPPDFTWPNIERALDKPARRPGGWYWWLSGIVLLFLGMGTWRMMSTHRLNPVVEEKRLTETKINSSPGQSGENAPASTHQPSSGNQQSLTENKTATSSASGETHSSSETINSTGNDDPAAQPDQDSKKTAGTALPGHSNSPKAPKPVSYPVEPVAGQPTVAEHSPSSSGKTDSKAAAPVDKPQVASSGKNPVADTGKEKQETAAQVQPEKHLPEIIYDQQDVLGHDAQQQPAAALPLLQPVATNENNGSDDATAKAEQPVAAAGSGESVSNELLPGTKTEPQPVLPQDVRVSLTEQQQTDSVPGKKDIPPVAQQPETLPVFFAGFHGAMENQKIASSSSNETGFTYRDVILYKGDTPPVVTQQTYTYGGRFGWFATKHLALLGGISFSTLEIASPGRFVRYNHNDEIQFDFHSASASAELSSSSFTVADNYAPMGDTFWVKIVSQEKYSFLNLQLGGSWYPLRTKHFGAYINVLSNGAYLTRQQMTLTSVKTGNTFMYGKDNMAGMNSFTIGGQAGIGFEFTPIRNLGIWIEPAYFFSNTINRNNAFNFRPSSVRLQCGLSAHF
jgi:hypothetical protein